MEQARHHHGDAGGKPVRLWQEVRLAQGEGGDRNVGQEIDHQIEPLAAPARQHARDADAAGEWAVNRVDDQGDAEPDEHPLPVAVRRGDERKQREGSACRGEEMNCCRAETLAHAASPSMHA